MRFQPVKQLRAADRVATVVRSEPLPATRPEFLAWLRSREAAALPENRIVRLVFPQVCSDAVFHIIGRHLLLDRVAVAGVNLLQPIDIPILSRQNGGADGRALAPAQCRSAILAQSVDVKAHQYEGVHGRPFQDL